jgi:mannan endo-1,6-alpha-mannosidase
MTRNSTLLHITEKLFNWIVDSGIVDLETGTVYDGVDTSACTVSTDQWSYSYGVSLLSQETS